VGATPLRQPRSAAGRIDLGNLGKLSRGAKQEQDGIVDPALEHAGVAS